MILLHYFFQFYLQSALKNCTKCWRIASRNGLSKRKERHDSPLYKGLWKWRYLIVNIVKVYNYFVLFRNPTVNFFFFLNCLLKGSQILITFSQICFFIGYFIFHRSLQIFEICCDTIWRISFCNNYWNRFCEQPIWVKICFKKLICTKTFPFQYIFYMKKIFLYK